jgi:hypothetical protein
MATLKTNGELIDELSKFPRDMLVGVYIDEVEEGGAYIRKIVVQKADDESTLLYHKGDNPVNSKSISEMLTICSRI